MSKYRLYKKTVFTISGTIYKLILLISILLLLLSAIASLQEDIRKEQPKKTQSKYYPTILGEVVGIILAKSERGAKIEPLIIK